MKRLVPLALPVALALSMCSRGPSRPSGGGPVGQASLRLLIPSQLQTTIQEVRVTIAAEDMDTIQGSLAVQDSVATGTISDIPAGPDRVFIIDVYKTGGIRSHTGADTTDIQAGQTVELQIVLEELTGSAIITAIILGTPVDTWTTGSPMPTARWGGSTGVLGGMLYVVGGYNDVDSTGYLTSMDVYDPVGDSWSTATGAPIPEPKHRAASGVVIAAL